MDDAAREEMLGSRIERLMVFEEYEEAAELLEKYMALRRDQGKVVPEEDRVTLCEVLDREKDPWICEYCRKADTCEGVREDTPSRRGQ